ncbi:hypothetical protein JOE68_002724 [Saccharothrix algeriensis]|uniref:Uncharacterized protein n=1 Tax=Saccharothrix algeriensis TaxID=173560 RepID=A0ABS2S847_9PSEU|nr:hypothetical protein [Saccharothrix algeriensis]MBM7811859.1 hypothetical protein [Saccharothrix algeriensis]
MASEDVRAGGDAGPDAEVRQRVGVDPVHHAVPGERSPAVQPSVVVEEVALSGAQVQLVHVPGDRRSQRRQPPTHLGREVHEVVLAQPDGDPSAVVLGEDRAEMTRRTAEQH